MARHLQKHKKTESLNKMEGKLCLCPFSQPQLGALSWSNILKTFFFLFYINKKHEKRISNRERLILQDSSSCFEIFKIIPLRRSAMSLGSVQVPILVSISGSLYLDLNREFNV